MSKDEIIAYAKQVFADMFGWVDREPSGSDIERFSKWFNEYGFTTDFIEYALAMAARSSSLAKTSYADKVLMFYSSKGIRSVEDAQAWEMQNSQESKPVYQKADNATYVNGGQRKVLVSVREDKKIQVPSVKMRPCPFCGYDGIHLVMQNSSKFNAKYVFVKCGQCEAGTKSIGIYYDVADDVIAETLPEGRQVIDLWNTRV